MAYEPRALETPGESCQPAARSRRNHHQCASRASLDPHQRLEGTGELGSAGSRPGPANVRRPLAPVPRPTFPVPRGQFGGGAWNAAPVTTIHKYVLRVISKSEVNPQARRIGAV